MMKLCKGAFVAWVATVASVATVVSLVSATSSGGPGYSASASYSSYSQYQQPQPQQQQDGQWYIPASQASYHQEQQQEQQQQQNPEPEPQNPETACDDDDLPPLPEGWSQHFDPNSGQYYYYNETDGTTTWDRPEPPEVELEIEEDAQKPTSVPNDGGDTESAAEDQVQQRYSSQSYSEGAGQGSTDSDLTPVPEEPSRETRQHQEQDEQQRYPEDTSRWGGSHQQQENASGWGSADSTDSVTEGSKLESLQKEEEQSKIQQEIQRQQPTTSGGWGLPQDRGDRQSEVPAWGVPRPTEQSNQGQPPIRQQTSAASDNDSSKQSPPIGNGRWGMPGSTGNMPPRPEQSSESSSTPQGQPWLQQQTSAFGQNRPMQRQYSQQPQQQAYGPPGQQGAPIKQRPPQQQQQLQQQQQPPQQQYKRPYQQPAYGQYNSNIPPEYGQYGQYRQFGQQYGTPQQQQSQQATTGQLVSQGLEEGSSAVKEALSSTWRGLMGFGNRTKQVLDSTREQVVTGATAAGQTLGARGSSFWEQAKSTVGSVFESNEPNSQQPYSLSGNPQQQQQQRPPPGYPGPYQPGRRPPPGYPGVKPQLSGRGPPPGYNPQQPGRYGPPPGQPLRYSGPPGQQQQPPPQQQTPPGQQRQPPLGYPPMQPRRDVPYPQVQQGQQRGPMQAQYGAQSGTPPPASGGGYPPRQQLGPPQQGQGLPPYPGPQSGGPPRQQQLQQQQQKPPTPPQQRDPWDHPALSGDH